MKILVTGAQGQVGREIMDRAVTFEGELIGLSSAQLDITDAAAVMAMVQDVCPDLIINAAAYTAVDKAEQEPERAFAVNRDGVANLAMAAQQVKCPVFHISTDYVFSGEASIPYLETDATSPVSVYGASKLAGELELARICPQHIILRTSWVFGKHGNNFVKTMLRLGREREQLSVVADQRGGPTSANSIADTLLSIATRYRDGGIMTWGVFHYAGMPACSWYEFAVEIFRQAIKSGVLTRVPELLAITTAQYPAPAKRPAWSVLDCGKIAREFGVLIRDWRDDVTRIFSN